MQVECREPSRTRPRGSAVYGGRRLDRQVLGDVGVVLLQGLAGSFTWNKEARYHGSRDFSLDL